MVLAGSAVLELVSRLIAKQQDGHLEICKQN